MAEQDYTGRCQCGAVRLRARLDLDGAIRCNCSRCRRLASTFVFAPAEAVTVEGEANTTSYRFNREVIDHRFCATCGIELHARGRGPDGAETVAVNVNCLDGVEAWTLDAQRVDGASF